MVHSAILERMASVWRWRSARSLLVVAGAIAAIISLFEIRLDAVAMLREVASNLITTLTITFVTATLTSAVGVIRFGRDWKRLLLLLFVLAAGGMLGGAISWGINDLLFPFNISHPAVYLALVAALSIIFGLAIHTHRNVAVKLEDTAARLAAREVQQETLLRLKTEAELEALRARVNPHFLFNTLNSIVSLIPSDPVKAEEIVQRMSNLFRYILSAGDRTMVPLAEELDIVVEYLEIEKTRLGSRLDYAVDIDEGAGEVPIPPMLLQPLVENSVKHGIAPNKAGGRIEIRCRRSRVRCSIEIRDTGRGFDTASVEEGFGIGGVRARLALVYPGSHEFQISSAEGVAITVVIPAPIPAANPAITPAVIPEAIPEVIPKGNQDVIPDVIPEVTPEVIPEVIPVVLPSVNSTVNHVQDRPRR